MSEQSTLLNIGSTGATGANPSGNTVNTTGRKNFSFQVLAQVMSTTGSDTLNGFFWESNTESPDFSNPQDYRKINLFNADSGARVTDITAILGNMTSGNAALNQKFNLQDSNFAKYIGFRATVAGTPANVKNVVVTLNYDVIRRTSL
jgi:hypothetical protein